MKAYRSLERNPATGQALLTFNPLKALNSTNPMSLPCGNCIGCRIDRADQWATRCMHEAQMHKQSSFITLTYSDEHLPENYSVSKREFQLFMKRLRKDLGSQVRYFASAEYGPRTLRPHYHALIFGHAFYSDRQFKKLNKHGDRTYTSPTLDRAWPFGLSDLGDVTHKSARYVAGYIMKKIRGDQAASHYLRTHPKTRQLVQVEPEFQLQSTKPGIGSTWFDKYKNDAFPSDFLVVEGRQTHVPRYYFNKLQEEERLAIERTRAKQPWKDPRAHRERKYNSTPERLRVREAVQASRLQKLNRDNIEEE
ncbi:MAG: replication initiator protein [Microvirus sp.]|nr:MAG: replication initiator protein [Microvirus sp.]